MIFSNDLTNKELLVNALPIMSLSRKQWNAFMAHMESLESEGETELFSALKTLCRNQSKIEILSAFGFYYNKELNEPVAADSIGLDI